MEIIISQSLFLMASSTLSRSSANRSIVVGGGDVGVLVMGGDNNYQQ